MPDKGILKAAPARADVNAKFKSGRTALRDIYERELKDEWANLEEIEYRVW